MRFTKQWSLGLGTTVLLAATSVQAYDVDSKTKQLMIDSLVLQ